MRDFASGGVVFIASTSASLASYVFVLLFAQISTVSEFSEVTALLALQGVLTTSAAAYQLYVARFVSLLDEPSTLEVGVRQLVSMKEVAWISLVSVVLSPVICWVTDSSLIVGLVTMAVVPVSFICFGILGMMQGKRYFYSLALVIGILGIARPLLLVAMLNLDLKTLTAMLVTLIATGFGAFAAWMLTKIEPTLAGRNDCNLNFSRPLITREYWGIVIGLVSLFALTAIDVVLARSLLRPDDAGVFSLGSIITKLIYFSSTVMLTLAYPRMVQQRSTNVLWFCVAWAITSSLAAFGILSITGSSALNSLGLNSYDSVAGLAIWFCLEGALLSIAQVVLYYRLARKLPNPSWQFFFAVALIVLVSLLTGVDGVVGLSAIMSFGVFVCIILMLVSGFRSGHRVTSST